MKSTDPRTPIMLLNSRASCLAFAKRLRTSPTRHRPWILPATEETAAATRRDEQRGRNIILAVLVIIHLGIIIAALYR